VHQAVGQARDSHLTSRHPEGAKVGA
jgi:hypothetical protein